MSAAQDLLNQLEGQWRLHRDIEAEGATMTGRALFTRVAPDALRYEETGKLSLRDGQVLPCSRRYRFVERGDALVILFDDEPDRGKTFVTLRFAAAATGMPVASDRHLCGRDTYSVIYRLRLPSCYETEVSVTGPRKQYTALSRYTRPD